jgi:hypothetical protein
MRVPQNLKTHILEEFGLVIAKLKEPIPLDERFYYYSAAFGAVYRAMNTECNQGLVFLHHTLTIVHSAFQTRLQAMNRGAERPVAIEGAMLEVLTKLTEDLRECIRLDQDSTAICIRLINLSYALSGNGYYLYKKGDLTL